MQIHHLLQYSLHIATNCSENKHIKRKTGSYISLFWRGKLFGQTFAHEYLGGAVMNMHQDARAALSAHRFMSW